jgi:hopanoid biosynthesis associated protein HpnK
VDDARQRRLIVTADDFGADVAVNEAVEQGHIHGILTAASLMVAGPAAANAVARARRLPSLGVGLHLVLVEGQPMLPPRKVPDLVGQDGHFRTDMARLGAAIFFRPKVRAQVRAEIEAQFAAFAATGLPLDHVNAHKHFHLHPTIAGLILEIGRRYGLKAARAPIEPVALLNAIEPTRLGLAGVIAAPWAKAVGRRFRRAGLVVPDRVFGLAWSGAMTRDRVAALIERLPAGLTEIYTHPATADHYSGSAEGYRYRQELAALTDPAIRNEMAREGIILGSFAEHGKRRTA